MAIVLTLFVIAGLLFFGLKTICTAEVTKERSFAGHRAISRMSKWQYKQFDIWTIPPLKQLLALTTRFVFLDEDTASRVGKILSKAELSITPQEYTARKHIIIAFGVCLISLCFFMKFFFGIILGVLGIVYALMRQRDTIDSMIKKKELIISQEMPRFVRTICRSLKSDRDLYNVINAYRKVAGPELGGELDILLGEMRSGNMQNALAHFENRIGTPEAFRLCGALRDMSLGVDQTATLNYMADDMTRQAKENIRRKLSLRPGEMRRTYYPAIAICIIMIMYVLVMYVINNLNNLY